MLEEEAQALERTAESYCQAVAVTLGNGLRPRDREAVLGDLAARVAELAQVAERVRPVLDGTAFAGDFENATLSLPLLADALRSLPATDGASANTVFDTLETSLAVIARALSLRTRDRAGSSYGPVHPSR